MSVESPNPSSDWNCAREALAEMRACPGELQAFVSGAFDRLAAMTDELLAHELAHNQTPRKGQRDALQDQIDCLDSVAVELAEAVAEQKPLIGHKSENP